MENKEEFIPLKTAIMIANTSEENIKTKLIEGVIHKYNPKTMKPLEDPIKKIGVFKRTEIIEAYSITDVEKNIADFKKKRKSSDSILSDIIPKEIIKLSNKNIENLTKIPDKSIDSMIISIPFELINSTKPVSYQEILDSHISKLSNQLFSHAKRILKDKSNLIVHSIQRYIPFLGMKLNKFMHFKYWIVYDAKSYSKQLNIKRIQNNGIGILYFVKRNYSFRINRVREPFTDCSYCNKPLKDYGGKKDQMHKDGSTISDVWKSILYRSTQEELELINEYDIPKPILHRLINLSCSNESTLLLAPFDGDLDEKFGT